MDIDHFEEIAKLYGLRKQESFPEIAFWEVPPHLTGKYVSYITLTDKLTLVCGSITLGSYTLNKTSKEVVIRSIENWITS